MRNFREYLIWIDAMEILEIVYVAVDEYPNTEKFA